MYPLVVRSLLDHDVGINGTQLIPDFQSVYVSFPFVDLLGDGYSNFVYKKYIILTGTNTAAIEGSEAYGHIAIPATFKPENNSYALHSFLKEEADLLKCIHERERQCGGKDQIQASSIGWALAS
ncbi:hypothetical protein V492_05776 [Pseudogymnoascus sp. VKM F-4246]|nr:hypothetical protein V492_05776 [Pseudogymnoascus sp. VKM F-4246]